MSYQKPTDAELENRFCHHKETRGQAERHERVRAAALAFAKVIRDACPLSAEMTIAINHVDMAMMTANAAIARHEQAGG
jgi:hypothetical protein